MLQLLELLELLELFDQNLQQVDQKVTALPVEPQLRRDLGLQRVGQKELTVLEAVRRAMAPVQAAQRGVLAFVSLSKVGQIQQAP